MHTRLQLSRSTRAQRGQTYIAGGLLVFLAVVLLCGAALNSAVSQNHFSRFNQPAGAAVTAIATVNSQLQAATMYDPTAAAQLAQVTKGTLWSLPAPSVSPQPWYTQSDLQPIVFKVKSASTGNVNFSYSGYTMTRNTLGGTITVPIIQKAPNGCDPYLAASDCEAH